MKGNGRSKEEVKRAWGGRFQIDCAISKALGNELEKNSQYILHGVRLIPRLENQSSLRSGKKDEQDWWPLLPTRKPGQVESVLMG
jgi:hypothetical protein